METRAHYVAVGSFVLTILFLAFVAVLWLGRVQLSQDTRSYYVFFKGSVAGLSKGSAVQYNGIPVGRVTDIRVDPDNVEQIQVMVEIDGSLVDIKSDARAFLESNILSGVSVVQIHGGTEQAENLEPLPGHRYPVIATGQSEFEQVKATLPEVMGDIKTIAHQLNDLLNEQNRTAIAESLANVRVMTANFADRSKELKDVVQNANGTVLALGGLVHHVDDSFMASDGLKDRASQMLGEFRLLGRNLNDTSKQLSSAIQENRPGLRDFSQHALVQVSGLVGDAKQMVAGLTRLTEDIQRNPSRFLFGNRDDGYRPK